jgi:hypothetical protein
VTEVRETLEDIFQLRLPDEPDLDRAIARLLQTSGSPPTHLEAASSRHG